MAVLLLQWSWEQVLGLLLGFWLLYGLGIGVYRLWLSPIAHIPGPKLAALTQWYEFYYDIILGGQYTFKILKLHAKYGPVVRISPWEVHVNVHDFHGELYGGPNRPRNRWSFFTKQFGAPHSALATVDHDHHKLRKLAINPFFSMQIVRNLQPVIEERVDALLRAFLNYAQVSGSKPINAMYPFSAYTNDVINEYAFARSDHLIEESDFGAEVTDNLLTGTHMGPLIKHANWLLNIVNALPDSLTGKYIPGWGGFLKMKKDIVEQIDEIKASENTDKWQLDINHPTIFHELIKSKILPPEEKTPVRLAQEGQILVQGGTLTTSWTIALAVFHLLNRPATLSKLRDELFQAIQHPDEVVPLVQLEQLPYLRAVVKEALRHGIGTSSRLGRVAPQETLTVANMALPPGTVVSMSPYMTVMDASIFPKPDEFHPERWLADEKLEKYLLVWGGGTRSCLGMGLAHAEMYLMLAKLFRRWGSNDDRREGDVGVINIYETTVRDCQMAADYFIPIPYKGSQGLRFTLSL